MAYAKAEITIDAPIEQVWQVMLDIARYPEWNSFVTRIDCADHPPQLGSDLTLHVSFANGMRRQEIERITRLEPPSAQGGDTRAALQYQFTGFFHDWNMVRGQRLQALRALSATQTHYLTEENLTGWLAWAAPIKQVRDGFARHARDLKARCENY